MSGADPRGARPGTGPRAFALLALALLAFAALAFGWRVRAMGDTLAEDAYITARFARNLAEGYGLVWNPGGERVEGYTSPLHVAVLAAGDRAGIPQRPLTRGLAYAAVLGMLAIFAGAVRQASGRFGAGAALLFAVYLMDGRLAVHASAGLETLPYAFLLALSWWASVRLLEAPGLLRGCALGAIDLLCLFGRPDAGVFVAGQALVLGAIALREGPRSGGRRLLSGAALGYGLAAVAGSGYLLWKLHYFGYLLPNPFYLKSNQLGHLHGLRFVRDFFVEMRWLGAVALGLLLLSDGGALRAAWRRSDLQRRVALAAFPTLAFLAYYLTVIHEVSFAERFEYPVYFFFVLVAAILLAPGEPLRTLATRLTRVLPRAVAVGLAACLALGAAELARRGTHLSFPWFRMVEHDYYRPIANALASTGLRSEGSLIFAAAGVVPYESGFRHIDPVGLTENALSGRTPISALEREDYLWAQKADVYIGPEPPASPGATRWQDDPRLGPGYVADVLLYPGRLDVELQYKRHYGEANLDELRQALHRRMRELRDHYVWLGEIPYPVPQPKRFTSFVYVRRDSPRADVLIRALQPLIARTPPAVELGPLAEAGAGGS